MRSSNTKQAEIRLRQKITDPAAFGKRVLGLDLWDRQKEILTALTRADRVAVKACHASGKTLVAAAAVLWWLVNHKDGVVITTAPTWVQVERVLWGEIRRLAVQSKLDFPQPSSSSLSKTIRERFRRRPFRKSPNPSSSSRFGSQSLLIRMA